MSPNLQFRIDSIFHSPELSLHSCRVCECVHQIYGQHVALFGTIYDIFWLRLLSTDTDTVYCTRPSAILSLFVQIWWQNVIQTVQWIAVNLLDLLSRIILIEPVFIPFTILKKSIK